MAGGVKRLQIDLAISTEQADQAAESYNQRQKKRIEALVDSTKSGEKAKVEAVVGATARRIQEAVKAQDAEHRAIGAGIKGFQDLGQKALDSAVSIGKMGAAMMGLSSAQGIVQMFADRMQQIREYTNKTADDMQRMRDSMRELQALRGELGVTGHGVSHVYSVASKTLQNAADVQAMESAGLGVGELAIGKTISKADFDKAMIAAGKMQTLEGGNADAYGQLMGQIALQAKGQLSPAEAEGRLNKLFQIQQPGGFKNMSQAASQYAKLNPMVMNDIYSQEEAMSMLSAMSVSSPDEAATKVQQFTRSVLAGRLKARGMAVSSDVDFTKTSDYMKGLGIGEGDTAMGMGRKIADDLAAQKARDAKFNAHDYLLTHGFGNQEDRLAIMDYAGLRNSGRLEKIEAAAGARLDNGAISRRFAERTGRDPFYARRSGELSEQAADLQRSEEVEDVNNMKRAAFARLKGQGQISGSFEEWNNSAGWNPRNWMFGDSSKVNLEAQHMVSESARRAGINVPNMDRYDARTSLKTGEDYMGDEGLKSIMQRTREAGGNPFDGAASDIAKAAKSLEASAEKLERVLKRDVHAPLAGKPTPVRTRP
jgi:hypothetical protein